MVITFIAALKSSTAAVISNHPGCTLSRKRPKCDGTTSINTRTIAWPVPKTTLPQNDSQQLNQFTACWMQPYSRAASYICLIPEWFSKLHTPWTVARVCSDVLVSKSLIYSKTNKQQLRNDLSSWVSGLHTFWNASSNWLWTHADTYSKTDDFLQMAGVHSCMCVRRGGGGYYNKSLFLVASKTVMCNWWDSTLLSLQLTLPTAMEILSLLKQWRKCRPYKFLHV